MSARRTGRPNHCRPSPETGDSRRAKGRGWSTRKPPTRFPTGSDGASSHALSSRTRGKPCRSLAAVGACRPIQRCRSFLPPPITPPAKLVVGWTYRSRHPPLVLIDPSQPASEPSAGSWRHSLKARRRRSVEQIALVRPPPRQQRLEVGRGKRPSVPWGTDLRVDC